ncbi:MATE family efflux transporter [Flavobacterium sp.]|uniref:MATE family efflux transporter n=1 Tax=Flavobacterium sp. TaxID=239 RepID=UPI0037BF0CB5
MNLSQYTKEFSYNLQLAYPVILGMLGHTLIGIVDNFMVGNLGSTELAAVSLGNSFIFIGMSLGIGFSTAITPFIAEADAEKNDKKIRTTFHHGLLLCTILGVAIFVLIVLAKPIMRLMNQPVAVVELASPYIDWVAFSLIPVIIFQGYKQFADGLSQTKYSMYAIYLANVVHVFFNYVLIYGVWGFPKLGILGAALGTVISRIMMVVFMHYIMKHNSAFKRYFKNFTFKEIKKSILMKIINLGFPSAMQMLFEVALFTAAIWLSGSLGKNSQAANQIALTLASSTFMVAIGFSVTAMIRVSNYRGLKDYNELIVIARSIFLLTIMVEVFFGALFVISHRFLPHLFLNMTDIAQQLDNAEIIIIASKLLLVAAVFQISDGMQVVVLGALRGLQDVKIPMYITFVAYWVVGFPISYYLGKYTNLGATGIWIGLLAGLTSAAFFLYIRFSRLTKRLVLENAEI